MKNWKFVRTGNGSGSWRGKFYEDSAGNSASVEKRGEGWQVYWEDARGYGKPLGTYKDERTAREVAEDSVESEMPDKIKANYKSKAVNKKTGNESIDKQEWSMFSGLEKDAEKEIGNRESLVGKYVWVRSKGDEWKCYVLQDHGNKLYIQDTDGHLGWVSIERVTGVVKNKKTGNDIPNEKIMDILRERYNNVSPQEKTEQDLLKAGVRPDVAKKLSKNPGMFTKSDFKDIKEIGNDESDLIKRGFVYKVIIPGKKPIYFNNPEQAKISAEANKGTVEKVGGKIGNKKTMNDFLSDHIKIVGIPDPDTSKEYVDNLKRARNAMNKKK